MTRDDVLKMAYDAGFGNLVSMPHIDGFVRFANMVADAEREECLAEIETGIWVDNPADEILDSIAAAIRARGTK